MWLSDFRVVLPDGVLDHGSVRIEEGRIVEVSDVPATRAAARGDGLILLPGFVDMHGDMIEREVEPRPGVRMPLELGLRDLDRRLSVAGVTTAYAALSFNPTSAYGHIRDFETTSALIRGLRNMAPRLGVDHRVHARFEVTFPKAISVIEGLIGEGSLDLLSLNDHTPGQGQYRDLERLIERTARERGLTMDTARDTIARRIEERSLPAEVMAATLREITAFCAAHSVPVASHDDDTVAKVALMHDLGVGICEFPVTMEAAAAARARGQMIAMGAPNALRGQSYSGNLSARDAHDAGLLDLLASDYHPSAILPAVLELAQRDPAGLAGAVRLATLNPARALGLEDRGAIRPGMSADLLIADDVGIGHIRATLRGGQAIYSDGTVFHAAA